MPVVVNSSPFRTTEKFFLTMDTFSTSTMYPCYWESAKRSKERQGPTLKDVRFSKVPIIERECGLNIRPDDKIIPPNFSFLIFFFVFFVIVLRLR